MRSKGKIATWHDEKGYGFIEPTDSGARVFVHIKAFANRSRRPEVGDVVTYAVSQDRQGRVRAETAVLAGERRRERSVRKGSSLTIWLAVLFIVAVSVSALVTALPLVVPFAYATVSLVTFVAYALDKSAARRGRWRTSEGTLHLLSLAGGWPGALVAQQLLRHKSRKTSFRVVFWATVLINCAALVWFHTADGRADLDRMLADRIRLSTQMVDS